MASVLTEPVRIAPARAAAAHVLLLVERGVVHADEQLRSPRVEVLSRQDRDLVTELVFGTLRWQRVLDREIAARLRDPHAEMDLGVIVALRLGAYQLLFLDRIPSHAAVHESVELAKQAAGQGVGGMVNAVLRRLLRERSSLASLRNDPAAAYPAWMVARWRERFGDPATQSICAYGQLPPPVTVRLAEDGIPRPAMGTGIFLARAARPLERTHGVPADTARAQDEASQLVGELAALDAGKTILDACAAPAGKTLILAERNPEAQITAMDVSAARLRLAERRHAWGEHVHFTPGDAAMLPPAPAYDTILCDVPCSGTGTLGRNPEIRDRLRQNEFARQAERQKNILQAALRALKPGGRIVYSTCSLEREENEDVVASVIDAVPDTRVLPAGPALERLRDKQILTEDGYALLSASALSGPYLRTLPGVHACDGFFAAILTRGKEESRT